MNTVPIENILGYNDKFLLQMMELASLQIRDGIKCIELHTQKLGKPTRTFRGSEFQFKVWETDRWTVYVNNHKGVCLEVPAGTDVSAAYAAWEDYRQKILTTS